MELRVFNPAAFGSQGRGFISLSWAPRITSMGFLFVILLLVEPEVRVTVAAAAATVMARRRWLSKEDADIVEMLTKRPNGKTRILFKLVTMTE